MRLNDDGKTVAAMTIGTGVGKSSAAAKERSDLIFRKAHSRNGHEQEDGYLDLRGTVAQSMPAMGWG